MEDDKLKEISNSITAIRILMAKEHYEKADEVAQDLQMNILDYIVNNG